MPVVFAYGIYFLLHLVIAGILLLHSVNKWKLSYNSLLILFFMAASLAVWAMFYLMNKIKSYAAPMLVVGCVLFGLGSLIVKFVPVGGYAIAFWRLLIASFIFWFLMKLKKTAFSKKP